MSEQENGAVRVGARVHFKLPTLPNFVYVEEHRSSIDVGTLDEATLRSLGAAWTEALVAHAKTRARYTKAPAQPSLQPQRTEEER